MCRGLLNLGAYSFQRGPVARHAASFFLIILLLFGWAGAAHAQDDGARAYLLVPDGTAAFTLQGITESSNQSLDPGSVIPDAELKLHIALPQFTQTFSIGGQQAAAFAVLPIGEVKGLLASPTGSVAGKSEGIGDLIIGSAVGLIGSPALAPAEFAQFEPGFALGILGKVYVPTGEYDSSKIINLGADRFAFQLGLPMSYAIGKSLIDPGPDNP